MSPSLIVAIVGTAGVTLAALERLLFGKKQGPSPLNRTAYAIIIGTLAVNITIQWIQYHNVTTVKVEEQKKLERELAFALWAYSNREEPALKYLSSDHKYVLGYYYFRDKKYDEAMAEFNDAIRRGEFVAPSKYMLAVITHLKNNDLSQTKEFLKQGITYDPEFSSLYLQRGILHAHQREPADAISDLNKAVDLSRVHCYTILRNAGDSQHPLNRLKDNPSFIELKDKCEKLEKTF